MRLLVSEHERLEKCLVYFPHQVEHVFSWGKACLGVGEIIK